MRLRNDSILAVLLAFIAQSALPRSAPAAAPISTASGTAALAKESTDKPAAKTETTTKPDSGKPDSNKTEPGKPEPAKSGKNFRTVAGFTPEREATALDFVRTNHPELAALLDRLKVRQPHEYQKAVRDLSRVSERLALSRNEFPPRYELELKQWKLTSRIQVLAARLSMKRTSEQEQELKQLLAEQHEAHRELVALNLERSKGRVASLSRELDDLDARKQAILDAKFDKVIKAADQRKPAGKSNQLTEKAAAEKKAEAKTDK